MVRRIFNNEVVLLRKLDQKLKSNMCILADIDNMISIDFAYRWRYQSVIRNNFSEWNCTIIQLINLTES